MLLHGVILKIAKNIKHERTASSIYHLLTGRRSIQTMQDAHIYGVEDFFGICKSLTKQDFEAYIRVLIQKGFLIEEFDPNQLRLVDSTAQADDWLNKHEEMLPFHYFKGMAYHEKDKVFYQRLLLLIQTFANTRENNYSFIPVVDKLDIEQWVKRFYKEMRGKEKAYLITLEKELVLLLEEYSSTEANIFVDRLTGYKYYGMTVAQLAVAYNKDSYDIQLLLVGIIHNILSRLENNEMKFPAIHTIIKDYKESIKLLGSTANTYRLFKQEYTPEEIASIRRLKINTIYDHIAEIALHDSSFPFHQFLTENIQREILSAIKQTDSFKLKEIKEATYSDVSFFQIRLMLVLYHKIGEEGELVD